ncbi:putative oxidoreductase [Triangularia verruculosa]|uniref:Oxidoreductase n=1 Tax=Triangularia verruculosa TaxID=2587418 RepID=A0AAN7B1H3_9PEZI|nr:putative oxidoreductase [Triangularia verruculosa]
MATSFQDALASSFTFAPPPKSPLARYRLLSPTAGVRVSPLCLGGANFGDEWQGLMGEMTQAQCFEILDCFYDNGGNFVDTANAYQKGQSEKWVGEWMKRRGNREEMFISTKYSNNFRVGHGDKEAMASFIGNGTKSLHTSVAASLGKLQTEYIDLLFVHWYDYATSIPEVIQSLNVLVSAGKVLYLGISDAPAWVVTKANQYARDHGFRGFSVYQGEWSAASRDFEREIIPMCREEGMGIMPWGALGGGTFKTDEQRRAAAERKGERISVPVEEKHVKVSRVLERVAERKGTVLTSVALAYVMHKAPYVFPVVGGRKVEYLKMNIEALKVRLEEDDIKEIEGAVEFDLGWPGKMMYGEKLPENMQDFWLMYTAGWFDNVPVVKPIVPAKEE